MHDSSTRLTLTPTGAFYLAMQGLFKVISDREIRDTSKADILGKGFVILQLAWKILQYIFRTVAG